MNKLLIRSLCSCFILNLSISSVHAQLRPLDIGDALPDVSLPIGIDNIQEVSVSAIKAKLIIFDFWNSGCTSCIERMPDMERLQKEFASQIQIILVTSDDKKTFEEVRQRSPNVRNNTLPMVIGDTTLARLFPNRTVPYHVWLDSNRVVRARTGAYATTTDAIKGYLSGGGINLPVKHELATYEPGHPLWVGDNASQLSRLKYFSLISGPIDYGQNGGYGRVDSLTHKPVYVNRYNNTIFELFQESFGGTPDQSLAGIDNRWILNLPHPEKIVFKGNPSEWDAWERDNAYCYEIQVPVSLSDKIPVIFRQDLERFFGLRAKVEMKEVSCLVIVQNAEIPASKGGRKRVTSETGKDYTFTNTPFKIVAWNIEMGNRHASLPVVDQSNYDGNVDFSVKGKLEDIDALRKALQEIGLGLVKKDVKIPMIVLSDDDGSVDASAEARK